MLLNFPRIQKRKYKTSIGKKRLWPFAVIGIGLIGLLCSCTTLNYGKLQSSFDITELFEKAQILPDHVYYYSGLQGVPDAIVGIHPNYTLRAKTWQQIDFAHITLKKWIYRMNYVQLVTPQGAWILGPEGDQLGVWYSAQRQTAVRLDKENRLVIAPPLPPELRGVP